MEVSIGAWSFGQFIKFHWFDGPSPTLHYELQLTNLRVHRIPYALTLVVNCDVCGCKSETILLSKRELVVGVEVWLVLFEDGIVCPLPHVDELGEGKYEEDSAQNERCQPPGCILVLLGATRQLELEEVLA